MGEDPQLLLCSGCLIPNLMVDLGIPCLRSADLYDSLLLGTSQTAFCYIFFNLGIAITYK